MFGLNTQCVLELEEEYRSIEDYSGPVARWCPGCGDHAILTAIQRFCRDEQLPPEKTVFVSGIGCAARFPHYMNTYGFHGLHGRALPIAEGIRLRRPDLHVFVNMGDGDCCSIGTAHWIHALRMNMNLVVMMHDNAIYGLTKKQASPTTPAGFRTNTTPRGAYLKALNPLTATLGVTNASFVAQATEWIPELLYDIIKAAYAHRGLSFIRILQRCPHFMDEHFKAIMSDPSKTLLLSHENGIQPSEQLKKIYKNQEEHDPANLHRAREIAEEIDPVPVGILYRNPEIPCYEDLRRPQIRSSADRIENMLNGAFDKFGIFPTASPAPSGGNGSSQ